MIHLGIRTEFSFRQTFGKIDETLAQCNSKSVGIADINSTYGHVRFQAECKEKGIKPIFGVRLEVLPNDAVKTSRS
jgi:DNA polymerase III alpha subunit